MHTQDQLTLVPVRSTRRVLLGVLLLFALVSASMTLQADGSGSFAVIDAHAWHDENGWFLDAQYRIRLSSGAREALENGVPLVFELRVQLVKTHDWLWDVVEHEHKLERQVQYHALSRSYLVKDLQNGNQGVFGNLEDALNSAGLIDALLVTDQPLDSKRDYMMRLRGSHDIESLPTPVRLFAYVSSDWDMNSQWFTWQLAQ